MKIRPRDLGLLRELVEPLDTPERRNFYEQAEYPRAAQTKDVDMRYRWDLFHLAMRNDEGVLVHELYEYLDDRHIDTALRSFIRPLDIDPDGA